MVLLLIIFLVPCSYGIHIIEVLPNPIGDDNNKEYVKIYSEEYVDLTSYFIGDEASNDTLVMLQQVNSSYSFIVEEGFNYTGINASIYSAGATIGNNLGNSADSVYLFFPNKTLIDSFSYTSTTEGICFKKYDNRWITGNCGSGFDEPINEPTKTVHNILKISSLLPENSYINQTIIKGFRVDHLGTGKIDASLTYTIYFNETILKKETIVLENITRYRTKNTIDVTFPSAGEYVICGSVDGREEEDYTDNTACGNITVIDYATLLCDRSLSIAINQTVFQNRKPVSYDFVVEGNYTEIPFTISYYIEEFTGEIVKELQNTSTDSMKHWTPSIKKEYGLYTIHAELIETGCNDSNSTNDKAETNIIVKNTYEEEGTVEIEHIYLGSDGIARTGDTVKVKIEAYSGNLSRLSTDKKSIKMFIENDNNKQVSDIAVFSTENSFDEFIFTAPLFLEYSCTDFPTSETQYLLVAEGFGMTAKQKFAVQGVNKKKCTTSLQGEYQDMEFTATAHGMDTVTSNITILNIDDIAHIYKASSKIYRGPKTYSGDFFENQQEIELLPGQKKKVRLENTVPALEQGTYKMKIYMQKDEQKTLKQFTHDIEITGDEKSASYTGEIISFTSLSSEPKKDIRLLAHVNSTENATLVLDSLVDKQELDISSGMQIVTFNTTLLKGKNLFVIALTNTQGVVDTESVIIYADEESITTHSNSTKDTESVFESITGHVVLEPASGLDERQNDSLSVIYSFIGAVVFTGGYMVYKKKHKLFKRTALSAEHED